jgi:hypothetical protein
MDSIISIDRRRPCCCKYRLLSISFVWLRWGASKRYGAALGDRSKDMIPNRLVDSGPFPCVVSET